MVATLIVAAVLAQSPAFPPPPRPIFKGNAPGAMPPVGPPLPEGQQLTAQDGDTVLISGDDRIRIVRRIQANVRLLYNHHDRQLILLVARLDPNGASAGFVDQRFVFRDVSGVWPLGDRWDGLATIDEYISIERAVSHAGYGITTPAGLVQLLPGLAFRSAVFRESPAVAITYTGESGGGMPRGVTFDAAEQLVLSEESRTARVTAPRPPPAPGQGSPSLKGPPPVRVGGTLAMPTKIVDVPPVYPAEAQAARIEGVVLIEATLAADGSVREAHVVHGVPQLDQAALDAVRQWQYTPTKVNGQAVPVIMTVTVSFNLRD